jgi:hypothetical protein
MVQMTITGSELRSDIGSIKMLMVRLEVSFRSNASIFHSQILFRG